MAFVTGGKHFGQYTYEHWFDEDDDGREPVQKEKTNEEPKLSEEEAPGEEAAGKSE